MVRKDLDWHDALEAARAGLAWQSSIVTVYADRVEVTRRDSMYGETLGEPWRVDFPFHHDPVAPYIVADVALAPQFQEGAKVEVSEREGTRMPDRSKERQVWIAFPAAIGDGPYARVFYYKVEALDSTGGTLKERKVMQRDVAFAEQRTVRTNGWCVFARDELPRGVKIRFRVYPQNTSGKEGRPIVSEPVSIL